MARSSFRVLKRRGPIVLVKSANPVFGPGYSVRSGSLGLWIGDHAEGERQFEHAVRERRQAQDLSALSANIAPRSEQPPDRQR